jgi:hypothetical protein
MKLVFTSEELIQFIMKKSNELPVDDAIMKSFMREKVENVDGVSDMLLSMHELGKSQGILEGRLQMLNDLFDYIESQK